MIDARCAASPSARNCADADDRVGRFGVDVRVLEEAERELLPQQAARRHVEALLGDAAVGDELEQQLGARLAAELVGSGIQDLLDALRAA